MKKFHVVLAVLLVFSSLLFGCEDKNNGSVNTENLKNTTYPIETDTKLTYWTPGGVIPGGYVSRDEMPVNIEYEKKLGVDIEWIVPVQGQESSQLSIMLASGDLYDIIDWYWMDYSGGPDKAIEDGAILPLNDIMEEYSPALTKYLKEKEYVDRRVKTDNGN